MPTPSDEPSGNEQEDASSTRHSGISVASDASDTTQDRTNLPKSRLFQNRFSAGGWKLAFGLATAHALSLWLAGPPVLWWPLCLISLVPLISIALRYPSCGRTAVYVASAIYWFVSLQGLRHAHPLMIGPLLALVAYLAIYPLLFVILLRQASTSRWFAAVPIPWTAAVLWVGMEWIRNHFLTGISVLMLGHALVDVPLMIQIADCFGTYGVSFLIVLINGAAWQMLYWPESRRRQRLAACSFAMIFLVVVGTAWYGVIQLAVPLQPTDANVLLIGRNDRTEYAQDPARAQEIFRAYAVQTIETVAQYPARIDAVVWPESMFSGGMAWIAMADDDDSNSPPDIFQPAPGVQWTTKEANDYVRESQNAFRRRAVSLQRAMRGKNASRSNAPPPSIIGGCPLVEIGQSTKTFSGIVMVDQTGNVAETYAKNHLVLFGETIPLVDQLPILREMMPPGLGLDRGSGPERFELDRLTLLPNLCIETAVERVAANHLRTLWDREPQRPLPDAIVTVTNDAWFNQSAVVEHHLRCARMVAVATRRPVLSAANGGPTAWIDSRGAVVERLAPGQDGHVLAQPQRDPRRSLYVRYGAVPAAGMGVAAAAALLLNMLWQIPRLASRVSRWRSRSRALGSGRGERTEP